MVNKRPSGSTSSPASAFAMSSSQRFTSRDVTNLCCGRSDARASPVVLFVLQLLTSLPCLYVIVFIYLFPLVLFMFMYMFTLNMLIIQMTTRPNTTISTNKNFILYFIISQLEISDNLVINILLSFVSNLG